VYRALVVVVVGALFADTLVDTLDTLAELARHARAA